ncbi:hypothetical protein J5N97_024518 [Dioscorea zingiberensis]|uniref:Uncharacterized protein n=1 Tax=Dioscorea zingiberensis TaxID=325984 RepID=A0A9D5C6J4_9LILI|nr:hypothetical protein J5N97_024518 [Dioscorea zingiberensis]
MPENNRSYADPPDHHNTSSSSSPTQPPSFSDTAPVNSGNVDRVLFKNLVEMVPLVESLMDRRASSSYSRRASMAYTPAPSQSRKGGELSGRKTIQTASIRKRRDNGDNEVDDSDGFSAISSKDGQKDKDEVITLLQEVNDLRKKLLEKEEALKSAEDLLNQMSTTYASLEELRSQVAEKDSLVKTSNLELYNVKIKLAEKQAALEKLVWEIKMSSRKIEELEGSLISKDLEVNALMQLFEEIAEKNSAGCPDYSITYNDPIDQYPFETADEIQMSEMEEARLLRQGSGFKLLYSDSIVLRCLHSANRIVSLQSFSICSSGVFGFGKE